MFFSGITQGLSINLNAKRQVANAIRKAKSHAEEAARSATFDFATALADHGNYDLLRARYPELERVFDVIDAAKDEMDQIREVFAAVVVERDESMALLRTIENPSDDIKDFLYEHADK